ncbi:MAG: hypothetical protein WCO90_01440 [Planctomycetota bacterium]
MDIPPLSGPETYWFFGDNHGISPRNVSGDEASSTPCPVTRRRPEGRQIYQVSDYQKPLFSQGFAIVSVENENSAPAARGRKVFCQNDLRRALGGPVAPGN